MPGQGRLGDKAQVSADAHGCPACPHPGVGPAVCGSPNVNVNSMPALRVDDMGIHAACCGPNTWQATAGSATVFINGKKAHRLNDANQHCGGAGKLIEGSSNVIVGDGGGGGSGSGGGGGSVGATAGSGGGAGGGGAAAASSQAAVAAGGGSASSGAAAQAQAGANKDGIGPKSGTGADGKFLDRHFLVVEMKAVGGVPLAREDVEIVDPATGKVVGLAKTDQYGKLHVEMPEAKEYELRVLPWPSNPLGDFERQPLASAVMAHLRCQFHDENGEPLAGAKVRVKGGGASFEVETGSDGEIDIPFDHGEFEVEVEKQKFITHTRMPVDYDPHLHKSPYHQFKLKPEHDEDDSHDPAFEAARENRYSTSDEDAV